MDERRAQIEALIKSVQEDRLKGLREASDRRGWTRERRMAEYASMSTSRLLRLFRSVRDYGLNDWHYGTETYHSAEEIKEVLDTRPHVLSKYEGRAQRAYAAGHRPNRKKLKYRRK